MNGISCLVSKSFSPIYNPITSNKADIIPFRSPNLHLNSQTISPLLPNTRVQKHRVYSSSSSKDVMGSISLGGTSSDDVGPYNLISLGLIGLALLKAWEFVAPSISSKTGIKGIMNLNGLLLGVATGLVARGVLEKIVYSFSLPPFQIGDIIQVDSEEGRVIKMGPTSTELCGAENCRIFVPNKVISSSKVVNMTKAGRYDIMSFNVGIEVDEYDKIKEITEEIVEMMKSYPNVLLDVKEPSWYRIGGFEYCFYCHLKQMDPDVYFTAKEDIQHKAFRIIFTHYHK